MRITHVTISKECVDAVGSCWLGEDVSSEMRRSGGVQLTHGMDISFWEGSHNLYCHNFHNVSYATLFILQKFRHLDTLPW